MSNSKRIAAAAVIVLAVVLSLWFTNRTVAPKDSTMADVRAEAEAGGYGLVTTQELVKYRREEPELLLVDTRQDWEYRTGHIEGALNFPMESTSWARWSKRDELARFLGPDKDKLLVFY